MLRIVQSDRYDSVEAYMTYRLIQEPLRSQDSHDIGILRPGYHMDYLFYNRKFDIRLGWFSAYDLIRYAPPLGDVSLKLGNFRPDTTRSFEPQIDRGRWSSQLGWIFQSNKKHHSTHRSSWNRETDTSHLNARGQLITPSMTRDIWPNRSNTLLYGILTAHTLSGPTSYNNIFRYITYSQSNGLDSFTITPSTAWDGTYQRFDLDEFVADCRKNPYIVIRDGYSGSVPCTLTWFDFNIQYYGDEFSGSVVLTYMFENVATSIKWYTFPSGETVHPRSDRLYKVTTTFNYTVDHRSRLGFLVPGTYLIASDYTNSVSRYYELVSATDNIPIPSDNWYGINSYETADTSAISPIHIRMKPGSVRKTIAERNTNRINILTGVSHQKTLLMFNSYINKIHDDIRPVACLSANDALESYSSSSNFLESIPELPAILTSIRDVAKIGRMIKMISSGDLAAVPFAIDLLADGYLAYKYGAKPLASDIDEARRIATMYYERLDNLSKDLPVALYGKFDFQIPGAPQDIPGKLFVTARSKMVLRQSPSGLLAYVIALDNVGLLPTLARIWDLVPFSFVIDWFTSLSDRFSDIDHATIRAALDVDYYIHTFEYRLILDQSFYTPFRRSGVNYPEFRVFKRERSLRHPLFQESRYDFHPPRGFNKHLLASGALLWAQS